MAEREEADLVLMGTTRESGVKEYFISSNTTGLPGFTKIPVLAVSASYKLEAADAIFFATNDGKCFL